MPIYEYRCLENDHLFEVLQGIEDPAPKRCRYCSSTVTKVVSLSSFHLKGSGWYVTDYKKNGANSHSETSGQKPSPAPTVKEQPETTAKKEAERSVA